MKILTRYIFKEAVSHSLLGLIILTFVFYFPKLTRLLELAVERNLPFSSVVLLFLLPFPSVLVMTIPIAVLLGALIGLSRMAADGEVIAAGASGVSLRRFAWPVLLFALIAWIVASGLSLVVAPASLRKLHAMESSVAASELPYEIRPRVFIDKFPGFLIYLKDVTHAGRRWKGVFIASTADPQNPKVTVAESGYLAGGRNGGLTLHLENGSTHEIDPAHPLAYSIISFASTDIHIPTSGAATATPSVRPAPEQSLPELIRYIRVPRYRRDGLVELNYRLALPLASLALVWAGVPLLLSMRRGGKAAGALLAIGLVFGYYIIIAMGRGLSLDGKLNPEIGLWAANAAFAVAGWVLVRESHRVRARSRWLAKTAAGIDALWDGLRSAMAARPRGAGQAMLKPLRIGGHLVQVLDLYVVRSWLYYFVLTQLALTGIYIIFDFFQLMGSIVRNHTPALVVLSYYAYQLPNITYLMLPLSVLIATLVGLSILTRTSQVTAVKAAGISLFRLVLPIVVAAVIVSGAMFVLGDHYLPGANRRQDALRNQIQAKPAQTFYRSGWQWMYGQSDRIFNYRFFDPDHNVFADLSVFHFDSSFHITRRVFARRAFWEPHVHEWILEDGWSRAMHDGQVTGYAPFAVEAFKHIAEPPDYFKRQVRTSEQMSILELGRYISELRQSGFDVVRLSVQFWLKFSYPLVALVVSLLGIPFAFTVGKKGALTGIALALGIAVSFWAISSLFQAMGNLNQLPPPVAAWCPDILFAVGGAYLLLRVRT